MEIARVGKEKGIYPMVVCDPGLKIPKLLLGRNCITTEILICIVKIGIYNPGPHLDTCLVAIIIKKHPFPMLKFIEYSRHASCRLALFPTTSYAKLAAWGIVRLHWDNKSNHKKT